MNNSELPRPVASPRGTTQSGDSNGLGCQLGAGTVIADQREAGRVSTRADPFLVLGPAVISFSGGRTSAYMLRRILDAYGGALPDDVIVAFDNTGREMPATLDFVHECGVRWNVPIVWLEYDRDENGPTFRVVSHNSASREGEPLDKLFAAKPMLPNPVTRFCTAEAKIRTTKRYLMSLGWTRWTNVVGLRADEPGRVERALRPQRDRWRNVCPLATASIEEYHVLDFWRRQPFDLRLRGPWEGNCDGCFLKSRSAISRMLNDYPSRMSWWARWEGDLIHGAGRGAYFRADRPGYAEMADTVARQGSLPFDVETDQELPCESLGCGI